MLYFAYAADLWAAEVTNWSRGDDNSILRVVTRGPAVLPNHRIAFPTYSDRWEGGEAVAVASPGKQVSGVLLELSDAALAELNRRAGREPSDTAPARLGSVTVVPHRGPPVSALAYQTDDDHGGVYIPPAARYLQRLAVAAADANLSMVWIMHLLSFRTPPAQGRPDGPRRQTVTFASTAAERTNGLHGPTILQAAPVRRPRRARPSRPRLPCSVFA